MQAQQRLTEKYRLIRKVATTATAEVYLASRTGADGKPEQVLVKRAIVGKAADLVRRFADETRIAASLGHPNIIKVHEIGADDGVRYMVLEHVQGQSLPRVLEAATKKAGRLPLEVALGVVCDVARALHYAHERSDTVTWPRGIAHGAVCPQNILVGFDGFARLQDFGAVSPAEQTNDIDPTSFAARLPYTSPERLAGAPLEKASDLFALGVLLYELTTGRAAFAGATTMEVTLRVMECSPDRPGTVWPGYPPALEGVVLKAMARVPAQRIRSGLELVTALEEFMRAAAISTSPGEIGTCIRQLVGAGAAVKTAEAGEGDGLGLVVGTIAESARPVAGTAPAPGPAPAPVAAPLAGELVAARKLADAAKAELADARREAEQAARELELTKREVAAARTETQAARRLGEAAQAEAQVAARKADAARLEAEAARRQTDAARSELENVHRTIDAAEASAKEAREREATARTDSEAAARREAEAIFAAETARHDLESARRAIEAGKAQADEIRGELSSLHAELKERETRAKEEAAESTIRAARAEEDAKEARTAAEKAQAERAEAIAAAETAAKDAKSAREEKESAEWAARTLRDASRKSVEEAEAKAAAATAEAEAAKQQLADATVRERAAKKEAGELAAARRDGDALRAALAAMQQELDAAHAEASEASTMSAEATEAIADAKAARAAADVARKEAFVARSESDALRKEVIAARAEAEALRRELAEARKALEASEKALALKRGALIVKSVTVTQSGAPVPPYTNLSADAELAPFIGRAEELRALGKLLGETAVIAVCGAEGIGRTRLSREACRRHRTERAPAGGVWAVDLSGVRDVEGICAAIASALELPLAARMKEAEAVEHLGAELAARGSALVLLDGIDASLTRPLREVLERWTPATDSTFVVVSARPIGVRDERVLELEPLSLPAGTALDGDATALLAALTTARREKKPNEAALAALAKIAQLLEGNPLAIELAAARTDLFTPAKLLASLSQHERPSGYGVVAWVLEWSWRLLTPGEQAVFARIAVFAGPFSRAAADEVVGSAEKEASATPSELLGSLVAQGLLRNAARAPQGTGAHAEADSFDLHPAVRQFAEEKLTAAGALAGAGTGPRAFAGSAVRHAAWAVRHAAWAVRGAAGAADLQAAADRALAVDPPTLESSTSALRVSTLLAERTPIEAYGPRGRVLVSLDAALAAAKRAGADVRVQAEALAARGRLRRLVGRVDEGLNDLYDAHDIASRGKDRGFEARILAEVGLTLREKGKADKATRALEQALAMARAGKDVALETLVQGYLEA